MGAHVSAFCLQRTFKERGIGYPFGMQLHGKTLGIIGMGAIGEPPSPPTQHALTDMNHSFQLTAISGSCFGSAAVQSLEYLLECRVAKALVPA